MIVFFILPMIWVAEGTQRDYESLGRLERGLRGNPSVEGSKSFVEGSKSFEVFFHSLFNVFVLGVLSSCL